MEERSNVDDTEEVAIQQSEWSEFSGLQKSFSYQETGGLNKQLSDDINPYDVFTLFVDDEIINLRVLETNRYAQQKLNESRLTRGSRMHKWKPKILKK